MTRVERLQVYNIAKKVRKWSEWYYESHHGYFYGNSLGLGGMCGISSFKIYKRLLDEGFSNDRVKMAFNGGHVYVMLDDYVIDLTATQFDNNVKPIVLKKQNNLPNKWWWRYTKLLNSYRDIAKEFENWPISQSPFHKKKVKEHILTNLMA
jgi:hypothetical protein